MKTKVTQLCYETLRILINHSFYEDDNWLKSILENVMKAGKNVMDYHPSHCELYELMSLELIYINVCDCFGR